MSWMHTMHMRCDFEGLCEGPLLGPQFLPAPASENSLASALVPTRQSLHARST